MWCLQGSKHRGLECWSAQKIKRNSSIICFKFLFTESLFFFQLTLVLKCLNYCGSKSGFDIGRTWLLTQTATEEPCASSGASEMLAQHGLDALKRLEKGTAATALASSNLSVNHQPVADISFRRRRRGISKVCSQDKTGKAVVWQELRLTEPRLVESHLFRAAWNESACTWMKALCSLQEK